MRCASLAVAAAVVVVNIFPDDDDDDDLTPKQPPRSSHKEEEEDKEIARRHTVALKEEDEEDLLPKRENASFREMNICVCFCVVLSCFVWVFPLGKNSILFRSFKEHLHCFLVVFLVFSVRSFELTRGGRCLCARETSVCCVDESEAKRFRVVFFLQFLLFPGFSITLFSLCLLLPLVVVALIIIIIIIIILFIVS